MVPVDVVAAALAHCARAVAESRHDSKVVQILQLDSIAAGIDLVDAKAMLDALATSAIEAASEDQGGGDAELPWPVVPLDEWVTQVRNSGDASAQVASPELLSEIIVPICTDVLKR